MELNVPKYNCFLADKCFSIEEARNIFDMAIIVSPTHCCQIWLTWKQWLPFAVSDIGESEVRAM